MSKRSYSTINETICRPPSSTSIEQLLIWLDNNNDNNNKIGNNSNCIEFRDSSLNSGGSGVGCFALKNFNIGDTFFVIPTKCIFSYKNALNTSTTRLVREAATSLNERNKVTKELLIWLTICEEYANDQSFFYPFVKSLDTNTPCPNLWPNDLLDGLIGTNIYKNIIDVNNHLDDIIEFLTRVRKWIVVNKKDENALNTQVFNKTTLNWARSHYVSRRYPNHFSGDEIIEDKESMLDTREIGLSNIGCLCPLLDILNHNSDQDWLNFVVKDSELHVICAYPIKKGGEIFSNYGSFSNEMFLFAYGFTINNNVDDSLTVKLMGNSVDLDNAGIAVPSYIGTYYIKSGGMEGVSESLWKALSIYGWDEGDKNINNHDLEGEGEQIEVGIEECELLTEWLNVKLKSLIASQTK